MDKNEYGLLLIKPDSFRLCIVEQIISLLDNWNLQVITRKTVQLDEPLICSFQPILNEPLELGEEWKVCVIEALTSGLSEVVIIYGLNALALSKVFKDTVRAKYGCDVNEKGWILGNRIHTAVSQKEFEINVRALYPEIASVVKVVL